MYVDGRIREHGKTPNSIPRAVPLTKRVLDAIDQLPPRIDTPLLFPGERGGHLDYAGWRRDDWTPAVQAAGLEHRTPYSLRHTFASFAIAAGIPTFEIARMMGTSIEQIEKTYGHLLPDALERGRAALEAFDMREACRGGRDLIARLDLRAERIKSPNDDATDRLELSDDRVEVADPERCGDLCQGLLLLGARRSGVNAAEHVSRLQHYISDGEIASVDHHDDARKEWVELEFCLLGGTRSGCRIEAILPSPESRRISAGELPDGIPDVHIEAQRKAAVAIHLMEKRRAIQQQPA